ncbi:phosphoribosylanthranilate isomerase [Bacillus weihaiensis]|uniref:N-(5'-phosphoribosyl)anthranilate isomerase n=1 Tax=Bacillus weihaiensis TaxID=1547283 RepID=A0A1L3MQJ7_9BACI|nr:phosphoribosylanthranilate isomerase [Bacillus weihaiensis]APH04606.1 hypothetical protein A9C19_07515 [Bacillus weihaiensis]
MVLPKLKYCGIRNECDLKLVSHSLNQYVGFIFAESKRKVSPLDVRKWLEQVKMSNKKLVAVFVNPSLDEIKEAFKEVHFDVIQFHGNESVDFIKKVKALYSTEVWKALHHHSQTLNEMDVYKEIVDGYVIDSRTKNEWGGTGKSFDWNAVPAYIEFSTSHQKACFIAGGVNKDNILRLIDLKPDGIDLSSGIEENEQKAAHKIEELEERVLQHVKLS